MHTVDHWKTTLRAKLREALSTRQTHIIAVLRETLAAIENAEAPPAAAEISTPSTVINTTFAGSTSGLRAGEIPRLALTPEAVASIITREIQERRDAAEQYTQLGRNHEASILTSQADLLHALSACQAQI